jgi:Rhamnan synthesis protein F
MSDALCALLARANRARDELAAVVRQTLATPSWQLSQSAKNSYPAWVRVELVESGRSRPREPVELSLIVECTRTGALMHSAIVTKGRIKLTLKRAANFTAAHAQEWARYALGKGQIPRSASRRTYYRTLLSVITNSARIAPRLTLLAQRVANKIGVLRGFVRRIRPAATDIEIPHLTEYSIEVPFRWLPSNSPPPRLVAVCHVFYPDMLPEMKRYLSNIPFPLHVFISTDTAAKRAAIRQGFDDWLTALVDVRVMENRGRNIAPLLVGFRDIYDRYDYVLHVHSKRSTHTFFLNQWRRFLLETLLGSPGVVASVFAAFQVNANLGVIGPSRFEGVRSVGWSANYRLCKRIARQMGVTIAETPPVDFPAGSMFWARTSALRPLLELGLQFADFPRERGQLDGTLAHALERLFYVACERAGLDWITISRSGLFEIPGPAVLLDSQEVLRDFVTNTRHSKLLRCYGDERR